MHLPQRARAFTNYRTHSHAHTLTRAGRRSSATPHPSRLPRPPEQRRRRSDPRQRHPGTHAPASSGRIAPGRRYARNGGAPPPGARTRRSVAGGPPSALPLRQDDVQYSSPFAPPCERRRAAVLDRCTVQYIITGHSPMVHTGRRGGTGGWGGRLGWGGDSPCDSAVLDHCQWSPPACHRSWEATSPLLSR